MILLGLAVDPFLLAPHLPPKSFSVNELENDKKTALFIGTKSFVRLRTPAAPQRILIFDIRERAENLQGLTYISDIDPVKAWDQVRQCKTPIKRTSILAQRNVIRELIEKNKDKSFIHLFNTNIYRIKFQPTRNTIRDTYLEYLNGTLTRAEFDAQMASKYPKRGETKDAVDFLMKLTLTKEFMNLQSALVEVTKLGESHVQDIAERYKIETFDINYLLANKVSSTVSP